MANPTGNHVDDLIIRPAVAADADQVGAMWSRLVAYHRSLDARLPQAHQDGEAAYARRVRDQLHDNYNHILVAEHKKTLIGFTVGMIIDMVPDMFEADTAGFLADIFVERAYRQSGVGRHLVDALSEWFRSRGIQHMEWYVAARNTEGRAFWHKLGGDDVMVRMRISL